MENLRARLQMLGLAGCDADLGDFFDPDNPEAVEDLPAPEGRSRATT